jgi:hypothetical protein
MTITLTRTTRTMSDLAELTTTVEQVRAAKFPHLSPDLVQRILAIEAENLDDRAAAMREIKTAVKAALGKAEKPHA